MMVQADPSFRVNELRPGLSKAALQAMYPGRLAFDSGDARNELYFVEPLGVMPQTRTPRDRLVLLLNDGRLATFEVMRTDEEVAVAAPAPALAATQPVGKFGVQIAARRSEAEARAAIDEMRARFPSLLGHEWATINRVSLPQGEFYRVLVGPLGSAQQAAQLCSSLKAQGAACIIRGT
jgi:cell division protein FtsN